MSAADNLHPTAESTTGHNWTHGWFPREMTPERKANFESARYG